METGQRPKEKAAVPDCPRRSRALAGGGLWESWRDPEGPKDGPRVETCTIITTAANDFMADLHDRMPVKLESDQLPYWLDCEFADKEKLKSFLAPRDWEDFEISEATL
nr:SOS response-associated peptidase family protein [Mariniblastus fucicola]